MAPLVSQPGAPDDEAARRGAARTDDIENRFSYHQPTAETVKIHESVRAAYRTMAHFVAGQTPEGRHQSLALTALQESLMWANAAVACDTAPPTT
jgi:hypothetical protein